MLAILSCCFFFLKVLKMSQMLPLPGGWQRPRWSTCQRCPPPVWGHSWRTGAHRLPPEQMNLKERKKETSKQKHFKGSVYPSFYPPASGRELLTSIFQRVAVHSVKSQRRSDHLQTVPFLLNFGQKENVWEEQSHQFQLRHNKETRQIDKTEQRTCLNKQKQGRGQLTLLSFLPRTFRLSSRSSFRMTPGPTPLMGHVRSNWHTSLTYCGAQITIRDQTNSRYKKTIIKD